MLINSVVSRTEHDTALNQRTNIVTIKGGISCCATLFNEDL